MLVLPGKEMIDDRWNENKKDEDNMKYEIQYSGNDEAEQKTNE
jgi:hypothetical protein